MARRTWITGAAVGVITAGALFISYQPSSAGGVCEDNVCSIGESWETCPWDCQDPAIVQQKPFFRVSYESVIDADVSIPADLTTWTPTNSAVVDDGGGEYTLSEAVAAGPVASYVQTTVSSATGSVGDPKLMLIQADVERLPGSREWAYITVQLDNGGAPEDRTILFNLSNTGEQTNQLALGENPPSVTVSAAPAFAGPFDMIEVDTTLGGSRGTAKFQWRVLTDGVPGLWSADTTTAASVVLGATGYTLAFASGTYDRNSIYSISPNSRGILNSYSKYIADNKWRLAVRFLYVGYPTVRIGASDSGNRLAYTGLDGRDNFVVSNVDVVQSDFVTSGLYIVSGAGPTYNFNDSILTATVTALPDNEWKLDLTPKRRLEWVAFPWVEPGGGAGANYIPVQLPEDQTQVWYPFLSGVVEVETRNASFAWKPFKYPGAAFAPLILISGSEYAQIMWASNSPQVAVQPAHANRQTKMGYVYGILDPIPASQLQTYRGFIRKIRSISSAYEPWMIGALQYRRWLEANFVPVAKPQWFQEADGFQYFDLMNSTSFSTASLDSRFDHAKDKWPWAQFWGQMSNYTGNPGLAVPAPSVLETVNISVSDYVFVSPDISTLYLTATGTQTLVYRLAGDVNDRTAQVTTGFFIPPVSGIGFERIVRTGTTVSGTIRGTNERFGCCLFSDTEYSVNYTPDYVYSRYLPSLATWVSDTISDGYHAGYYSREPSQLVSPSERQYDFLAGRQYTSDWLTANQTTYNADAFYVDVVGRGPTGAPATVSAYMDTWPAATVIEGFVDIYSPASLLDGGICDNPSWPGGPTYQYNTAPCTDLPDGHCLAPVLGRFIMGSRYGFSGYLNGELSCGGSGNDYWVERQAFLLGNKQVVSAETAGNTNAQQILNYDARAAKRYWERDPSYSHTAGITNVPANITIRKAIGSSGEQIFMIDNPDETAGQTFRSKGRLIAIPADKVSVVVVR